MLVLIRFSTILLDWKHSFKLWGLILDSRIPVCKAKIYGHQLPLASGFLPTVISQFYPTSQLLISGFSGYHSHRTLILESLISGTPISLLSHHPYSDITVPELRYWLWYQRYCAIRVKACNITAPHLRYRSQYRRWYRGSPDSLIPQLVVSNIVVPHIIGTLISASPTSR